jgi:hypothetical protein
MGRPYTTDNFYRKKIDVLARQVSHYRYLQRWALKLLEELESTGITEATYTKFRDAIQKTGADIQGPGHPHIVRGVKSTQKKIKAPNSHERHKFPTRDEIACEVKRLTKCTVPFSDTGRWELM